MATLISHLLTKGRFEMPQLRKDPVIGRWVIIATERARRPGTFLGHAPVGAADHQACPFCNNQDPVIYTVPAADPSARGAWRVKVTPSGTPLLKNVAAFKRRGHGLYDVSNDYGTHEVVIETPDHVGNIADLGEDQISLILQTYGVRFRELEKNPLYHYVIAYKNYGWAAGSRNIHHSRSQIIATAVNPVRVKEKLVGAKKYFDYHDRCLYCDLVRQEREDRSRVVAETEHFIAVIPFAPRFIFELCILPKRHHCDFHHGIQGQEADLAQILKEVLLKLKVGVDDPSYNFIIQTAPFRRPQNGTKWRTIAEDYHWHIEVMPRLTRVAGFEKGSGFYICAIPPEDMAEFLREVKI